MSLPPVAAVAGKFSLAEFLASGDPVGAFPRFPDLILALLATLAAPDVPRMEDYLRWMICHGAVEPPKQL